MAMTTRLAESTLAKFRRLLEAQQQSTLLTVSASERNMGLISDARKDSSTDDEHDPEGVTLAYERSQESAIVELAARRLAATSDALAKLDTGTYGVCESCGRDIAVARLEARPEATLCIDCARRETSRRLL